MQCAMHRKFLHKFCEILSACVCVCECLSARVCDPSAAVCVCVCAIAGVEKIYLFATHFTPRFCVFIWSLFLFFCISVAACVSERVCVFVLCFRFLILCLYLRIVCLASRTIVVNRRRGCSFRRIKKSLPAKDCESFSLAVCLGSALLCSTHTAVNQSAIIFYELQADNPFLRISLLSVNNASGVITLSDT